MHDYDVLGGNEITEWLDEYPVHPVASLFPMMPEEELKELAESIKTHGQLERITTVHLDWDTEIIIDGRNRYTACKLVGIKPVVSPLYVLNGDDSTGYEPVVEPKFDNIAKWIMRKNVNRRHLSQSQKAVVAVSYEEMFKVEAKKRQGVRNDLKELPGINARKSDDVRATDSAGELLGVSGRYVREAKYIADHDMEELNRVKSGETTVTAAAKKIRNPEPKPPKPVLTEEEQDKQDQINRGKLYIEAFVSGVYAAHRMRTNRYREEILAALDPNDRNTFLNFEKEVTWPAKIHF